jgi:hypothetical protein
LPPDRCPLLPPPQTQATLEALTNATHGTPRHPLRLALGGNFEPMTKVHQHMCNSNYPTVQSALNHLCKMRMFAPPEFVRRVVADGVKHKMPAGIVVQRVLIRMGTLAAIETGTEMVEMSFADLALRIMGTHVSFGYREKIRDIFTKAEAFSSEEILSKVEQVCSEIQVHSIAENTAKQAVLRLQERLSTMLTGKLPECPITMEPIPKGRVRILGCCTCVIDSDSLPGCKGRCPLCRSAIESVGAAREPVAQLKPEEEPKDPAPSSKATGKRPASFPVANEAKKAKKAKKVKNSVSDLDSDLTSDSEDSDDEAHGEGPHEENVLQQGGSLSLSDEKSQAFRARLNQISQDRHYNVDGVMHVLHAQIELNPSSRMLLCFAFDRSQGDEVGRLFRRIRAEFPDATVTDIDKCVRNPDKMDEAKTQYDNTQKYPQPQIFVINTVQTSSSVQGLDLYATDLTLVASECEPSTKRQAVGRSLRMRNRPDSMKPEERFPAKYVVVTSIVGYN